MGVARQAIDIVIAGLIAGISSFVVSALSPDMSVTVGVALAIMYYFSRYPWGSTEGEKYNEMIEDLYDQYLPF